MLKLIIMHTIPSEKKGVKDNFAEANIYKMSMKPLVHGSSNHIDFSIKCSIGITEPQ